MGRRAWQSTFGNVRSFVGNALGGMRGWNNVASWAVAGTLAYFLWVKPAQQLRKEEEVLSLLDRFNYLRLLIRHVPLNLLDLHHTDYACLCSHRLTD